MSDTLRAVKIIASTILIVGGGCILALSNHDTEWLGIIILLVGAVLFLESWFKMFSTLWKVLNAPPPGFIKASNNDSSISPATAKEKTSP